MITLLSLLSPMQSLQKTLHFNPNNKQDSMSEIDINQVLFIGRIWDEPELKSTSKGASYLRFRLEIRQPYQDKKGITRDKVLQIAIVLWGNLAQSVFQNVHKDTRVLVRGELNFRSYQDNYNNKKWITEVNANLVQIVGR